LSRDPGRTETGRPGRRALGRRASGPEAVDDLFGGLFGQIPRDGQVFFEHQVFDGNAVIEKLLPLLTDSRKAKIHKVVAGRSFDVVTVCDSLYDVGNISAVMRSAESFGFLRFLLLERPGATYKKSDRVSRGSEKWLDTRRVHGPLAAVQTLKAEGLKILATTLEGGRPLYEVDLSQRMAIVFGNEKDGVGPDLLAAADEKVFLPMHGFAESFNISVAAALCFQEIHSAQKNTFAPRLSPAEVTSLTATYFLRSIGDTARLRAILRTS
jgi:tRNA (guanosine-2'-O-)-methyltransferase